MRKGHVNWWFALVALVAMLAIPATASAAPKHHKKHHVLTCKAPLHRNGNKCVPVPKGPAGPQGPAGSAGTPGKDGTNGTNGKDGVNGVNGTDGTDGTNGTDGADGATGPAGPTGPAGGTGPAGPAGPEGAPYVPPAFSVVYDNTPTSLNENLPSLGYAATSASEFGSLIDLAGTNRSNSKVTADMSVWSCETGSWSTEDCATTPGATFTAEITLNVYSVANNQKPGGLIRSVTMPQTFTYRPTGDCTDSEGHVNGGFTNGGQCEHGVLEPISFDLAGSTLPDEVIVSVAFNGLENAGTEALNLALTGPPSVGTNPFEGELIYAATGEPNKGGGELPFTEGFFEQIEEAGWNGYEPAIKVEAN